MRQKDEQIHYQQSVAVVGSSGGGTATLGHTDPINLLTCISKELNRIHSSFNNNNNDNKKKKNPLVRLKYGIFISLCDGKSMDSVQMEDDMATLYTIGCDDDDDDNNNNNAPPSNTSNNNINDDIIIKTLARGPLCTINTIAKQLDEKIISKSIRMGETTALISISSDPMNVHAASFQAASDVGIPVTGSGGTSLSLAAAEYGIHMVGNAGGSVATTTYTKAVSYVYALSSFWNVYYNPFSKLTSDGSDGSGSGGPAMGSILDSCLPAFIAVCIARRGIEQFLLLQQQQQQQNHPIWMEWNMDTIQRCYMLLCDHVLPTVCAAITASARAPEHESTAIMAGVVAGLTIGPGSVIAGLLAGWIVSILVGRTLFWSIRLGLPATMTNILVAGGVGIIVGLTLACSGTTYCLAQITHHLRSIVRLQFNTTFLSSSFLSLPLLNHHHNRGLGALFGCIFVYGSKVGWYHSIFLPVILLEMERGEASVWGAVDECTLVLVSAGLCSANLLYLHFFSSNNMDDDDDDNEIKTMNVTESSLSSSSKQSSIDSPSQTNNNNNDNNNTNNNDDNITTKQTKDQTTTTTTTTTMELCWRGLRTNLLCGDFIEVAYPFMEETYCANVCSYLAAALSTEVLFTSSGPIQSSAYLPVGISLWLSKRDCCFFGEGDGVWLAFGLAFGISFIGGWLGRMEVWLVQSRRQQHKQQRKQQHKQKQCNEKEKEN